MSAPEPAQVFLPCQNIASIHEAPYYEQIESLARVAKEKSV